MSESMASASETILETVARLAEKRPESPVLLTPGRPLLTYRELAAVVLGIRRGLHALGIARRDRVAIVLPAGAEMASAFLGTAAHCCAAPLNPAFGEEELAFSLSDLGASAIILPERENGVARAVAAKLGIAVLDLAANATDPAGAVSVVQGSAKVLSELTEPPGPDDVALVLHTSGTTARPKIVPLTQRNLSASANSIAESLALTDRDRGLNVMPLFHIHGLVAGILAPIHAGGSVVCPAGFDPDTFFDCAAAYQTSWYTAVPTIHRAILSTGRRRDAPVDGYRFRFVRSSSSPLPPPLMTGLSEFFAAPVVEAYGMTEAAHQITCNPVTSGDQRPGSVGLPALTEVRVVDAQGTPLPTGELGEIAIRGDNVTRGYEGDAAVGEEAFFAGWFRTGDEGRFDESGYLYLTGRLKEIINRGGEKVSPREVDDVLSEHPAVRQAVTFPVAHETLGEDVIAAVILEPDSVVTEDLIRGYCFDRMADYKVPTRIVFVDAIPVGATGKLQRFAMAEMLADVLEVEFDAPATRVEGVIATLVAEVTGAKRVGAGDNFFALGGDSIRGLQLISRIHAMLQLELSPVTVFHHPTVRALSVEVARAAKESFGGSLEELLAEIEGLSDEDAESLLQAENAGLSGG